MGIMKFYAKAMHYYLELLTSVWVIFSKYFEMNDLGSSCDWYTLSFYHLVVRTAVI